MTRRGSVLPTPEREVCEAAKGLLLAIDGYTAENEWAVPFNVHLALVVLGEKLVALDKATP